MVGAWYVYRRFGVEVERSRRTERLGHIKELPAHHFHNRGGVLVKKEFVGFEKYHQNGAAVLDWYKRSYPDQFKHTAE